MKRRIRIVAVLAALLSAVTLAIASSQPASATGEVQIFPDPLVTLTGAVAAGPSGGDTGARLHPSTGSPPLLGPGPAHREVEVVGDAFREPGETATVLEGPGSTVYRSLDAVEQALARNPAVLLLQYGSADLDPAGADLHEADTLLDLDAVVALAGTAEIPCVLVVTPSARDATGDAAPSAEHARRVDALVQLLELRDGQRSAWFGLIPMGDYLDHHPGLLDEPGRLSAPGRWVLAVLTAAAIQGCPDRGPDRP